MKNISFEEIKNLLDDINIVKGDTNLIFSNIQSSENINENSLDWVNPIKKNKIEYIKNSKAPVILCELSLCDEITELPNKCIIFVKNPKLTFMRIAESYFSTKPEPSIHKTASLHPAAEVSADCHIGANSYLGKCKIGNGSIIYGNCFIYDNTTIGDNVIIHAGSVLGADGFGYQRNEKNEFEKFPHFGGIIIKNNVEIGSNTCIDRGTLGNTIIEEGTKIDNQVHIAHNCKIGKHTAIIANTLIGGSTVIGDYVWISPAVTIRDQLIIGSNVTIGMGSVVTKNIPDGETWAGVPAMPFNKILHLKKELKKL